MTLGPQKLLRAGFMRVEAVFNRAFGDKLNPFYHLGALSFYLFWLIAGTGLYLYVFFDTSVDGAYRSVELLTHKQWYAGGVIRSVHRYASDAMVVTMFIHLARYWAFDRLRGFRASRGSPASYCCGWCSPRVRMDTCCRGTVWPSS